MKPKLDSQRFLTDHFDDKHALFNALAAGGFDVPLGTCSKWIQRRAVPIEWAFVLAALRQRLHGVAVQLDDYLIGGDKWESLKGNAFSTGTVQDVFA